MAKYVIDTDRFIPEIKELFVFGLCVDDTITTPSNIRHIGEPLTPEYVKEHFGNIQDQEIKVGDEIVSEGEIGVVLNIDDERVWLLMPKYDSPQRVSIDGNKFTKTGRHFTQVTELMMEMQDGCATD